jgi:mycobactin peptide synthetase MbtF
VRIAHAWSFAFDAAWQPLVALLDGHVVHVVDEHTQTDAEALVAAIDEHGVDMIDTTPSMFAQLRSAGLLTRVPLAVLALGGEALGGSSWSFIRAQCDRTGMTAFNCYGPTETTVEAVVAAIDQHDEPSIGHPTEHTRCYVLDSALRPVPNGVAGELYLGGAQLARGYLNRAPETIQRFVADPFVEGMRMYRTGDLVRRQSDGSLHYVGRADAQVKIRGHRVEPGEIAVVLESHSAVRQASVLVRDRDGIPRLTAYITAHESPSIFELRRMLIARLPRYMVPQRIVVLDDIPLTSNGKIDEAALAALDSAAEAASAGTEPETATELALAQLVSEVLRQPQVDVAADFIELGLDSIAALSVVQAARNRGIPLRARLILECSSIRELADAVDTSVTENGSTPDDVDRYGEIIPAPIVSWMYEHGNFRRFSQMLIIALPAEIAAEQLEAVLQAVVDRHDMLRASLDEVDGGYRLISRPPGSVKADELLTRVSGPVDETLANHARAVIDSIDPFSGAMVRALWCDGAPAEAGRMLLVVHHLATDAVSWYVLLAGLSEAWARLVAGEPPTLDGEYTTYREWSRLLEMRSHNADPADHRDYWLAELAGPELPLGARLPDPKNDTWESLRVTGLFSEVAATRALLEAVSSAGPDIGVREFLLTVLTLTLTSWRRRRGEPGGDGVLVALEGHGREDAVVGRGEPDAKEIDTSLTVGWFTNVFPLRLGVAEHATDVETARRDPEAACRLLRSVSERVSAVPDGGLDYGLLRYQRRDAQLVAAPHPQVEFNYLGRVDLGLALQPGTAWTPVTDDELTDSVPMVSEPDLPLRYTFDVIAVVEGTEGGPRLRTSWIWSDLLTTEAEAAELVALWQEAIEVLTQALEEVVP